MPKFTRSLPLLLAALVLLVAPAEAQIVYTFSPESSVLVDGTSNKSDWTVEASEFEGTVQMKEDFTADDPGVTEVSLVVPVAKIVSNRSTIMDRLMYRAFDSEANPEINFDLSSAEVTQSGPNSFTLHTVGELSMGGATNEIEADVAGEMLDDGNIRFTGEVPIKMTDYGMTPPTAMFGALRTGDEVTVRFDLLAQPE